MSAVAGQAVTIFVTGQGTSPFTYQWQRNDTPIPGATNSTLVLNNAQLSDSGIYTAVITNIAGSAISDQAIITISAANEAPVITTDPISHSAQQGSTTNFVVAATGLPAPTYQWRKDGVNLSNGGNISGATSNTLVISNVASSNDGNYSVVVSNVAGSVTSNIAAFTAFPAPVVNQAPVFVTQPTERTVYVGQSVSITATASGSPAPVYQWQKDNVILLVTDTGRISGANTPTLTISNVITSDAGSYSLVAANSVGTVTSANAALTVKSADTPSFIKQPISQTANYGSSVIFSVQATGYPTPTLQWRKNGVNLANGTTVNGVRTVALTVTVTDASAAGVYSVVATNVLGEATSNDATLTVGGSPGFQNQPPPLTVASSGTTVTLSLSAPGASSVQWRRNGIALTNAGNVSGATSTTLTLTGITPTDAGIYTLVATSPSGSSTSNPFEIQVLASNVTTQTVTSGHNVTLAGGTATGSLQWQFLTATGIQWTNLADNGTYHGVNTNSLDIVGVTESQNGNQYRLISTANGNSTVVRTLLLSVAAALLPYPVGVAADLQGNLFVSDTSTDTIQKIDSAGHISLFVGTAGSAGSSDGSSSAARFNDPIGLTRTPTGNLGISDNANATFRVATAAGVVTTLAGSTSQRGNTDGTGSAATFSSPSGAASDGTGNFYVADATNHTIRKITAAGVVTTFAGAAGSSGSADGTGSAARFNNPTRITMGGDGNIYVSDTTNNLIRKITPAGAVTTFAGVVGVSGFSDGSSSAALFNRPTGISLDTSNNVYVADTGNSTIRRISPAGVVTTYAGLAGIAGLKDGTGNEAWFNQPLDLTFAPNGTLYVADTGNAIVRQIAPGGAVTSLNLSRIAEVPPVTVPSLPSTPSLPDPLPTPTLPSGPTAPTPASSGGGGGAPSLWFLALLSALWLTARRSNR